MPIITNPKLSSNSKQLIVLLSLHTLISFSNCNLSTAHNFKFCSLTPQVTSVLLGFIHLMLITASLCPFFSSMILDLKKLNMLLFRIRKSGSIRVSFPSFPPETIHQSPSFCITAVSSVTSSLILT